MSNIITNIENLLVESEWFGTQKFLVKNFIKNEELSTRKNSVFIQDQKGNIIFKGDFDSAIKLLEAEKNIITSSYFDLLESDEISLFIIVTTEEEEEESDTITEYVCFKCFNVHKGQICPVCHPSQPKKKQSKKQPKKTYELVLANRDEYGDCDEIYHFNLDDIQEAKKFWIDCECNTIDVNEYNQYELVDQYDWTKAPKYIQKIAKKIMS